MEDSFTSEILSPESKNPLSQAGKWAKIVGIVGIVFACLMEMMSLLFIFGMKSISGVLNPLGTEEGLPGSGSIVWAGIIYLLVGAVYFYMSLCAYRFGNLVTNSLRHNSPNGLALSFINLKSYFTIHGVILLAVIAISFIGILMVGMIGFFIK